jgi:hypothetical protein
MLVGMCVSLRFCIPFLLSLQNSSRRYFMCKQPNMLHLILFDAQLLITWCGERMPKLQACMESGSALVRGGNNTLTIEGSCLVAFSDLNRLALYMYLLTPCTPVRLPV